MLGPLGQRWGQCLYNPLLLIEETDRAQPQLHRTSPVSSARGRLHNHRQRHTFDPDRQAAKDGVVQIKGSVRGAQYQYSVGISALQSVPFLQQPGLERQELHRTSLLASGADCGLAMASGPPPPPSEVIWGPGQPRPTDPATRIRNIFLEGKTKLTKEARNWNAIFGTQTIFWHLTHVPQRGGGGGGLSNGLGVASGNKKKVYKNISTASGRTTGQHGRPK